MEPCLLHAWCCVIVHTEYDVCMRCVLDDVSVCVCVCVRMRVCVYITLYLIHDRLARMYIASDIQYFLYCTAFLRAAVRCVHPRATDQLPHLCQCALHLPQRFVCVRWMDGRYMRFDILLDQACLMNGVMLHIVHTDSLDC